MPDNNPPTRPGHPLWGLLPQYRANPIQFMTETARDYEDLVRLRFAMVYIYATCNPDLMNEVLVKQASKFKKDRIQIAMLRRFLGNGLTANEGESWRRQRRLIQPAFHSSHHNSYVQKMVEKIAQMREGWQDNSIIELHQEMVKVTLHIVTEVLFGADAASTHTVASPEVYAAMDAFMK